MDKLSDVLNVELLRNLSKSRVLAFVKKYGDDAITEIRLYAREQRQLGNITEDEYDSIVIILNIKFNPDLKKRKHITLFTKEEFVALRDKVRHEDENGEFYATLLQLFWEGYYALDYLDKLGIEDIAKNSLHFIYNGENKVMKISSELHDMLIEMAAKKSYVVYRLRPGIEKMERVTVEFESKGKCFEIPEGEHSSTLNNYLRQRILYYYKENGIQGKVNALTMGGLVDYCIEKLKNEGYDKITLDILKNNDSVSKIMKMALKEKAYPHYYSQFLRLLRELNFTEIYENNQ